MKAIVRTHYPHFLAEDRDVWSKFLKTDAAKILECWYDVRIGQPIVLPSDATDLERRIAGGLTRKRIDVICRVADGLWVVEVKPYANMYAVGQIISYVRLFNKEFAIEGEVIPVLVCDSYDEDLLDEFDEFGILVLTTS